MFENRPRLLTGSGGMFICLKLGQNLSEIEVRTFARIQRVMNDLPVIGYRAMRKELWDRQGASIVSCWKEMYGEKLFPRPKKGILEGDQHFFAVFLSQMDLGNVEMRKM